MPVANRGTADGQGQIIATKLPAGWSQHTKWWWTVREKPLFQENAGEQWKNPKGCLVYIGAYTTQLYRDYNKPLKGSLLTNQYNGK